MSTNSAAAAALAKPVPHQLALTRGAIYILEMCLTDMGPCKTPAKTLAIGNLWEYVRSLNDRLIKYSWADKPVDFEKQIVPLLEETQNAYNERVLERETAMNAWMTEPQTLTLTDKRRDIARDVVKWVIENQGQGPGKSTTRLIRSKQLNAIIKALGLAGQEDDEVAAEAAGE